MMDDYFNKIMRTQYSDLSEEDKRIIDEEGAEAREFSAYSAKWNCNKIRKMIAEFLATKEMTQTEFLKQIGVSIPTPMEDS